MPKKTTLLILFLSALTGMLLYLALQTDKRIQKLPQALPKSVRIHFPTPAVEKTATVYFSQPSLTVNSQNSTPTAVDIMTDTGASKITGVQVELAFDPQVISSISLSPPHDDTSFFGPVSNFFVLFNETDLKTGKITYAIGISPQTKPLQGTGKIGTLTFSLKKSFSSQTVLSFTPKTLVTKEGVGESILKSTTPLTITISH